MPPNARRLRRPLAMLVAVFLGLGGLGTAAGLALGAVSVGAPSGHGHHQGDPRLPRPGR